MDDVFDSEVAIIYKLQAVDGNTTLAPSFTTFVLLTTYINTLSTSLLDIGTRDTLSTTRPDLIPETQYPRRHLDADTARVLPPISPFTQTRAVDLL